MGRHEKREDYQRPQEVYSTHDLCSYARDILLSHGDTNVRENAVTASWDGELASIHLTCSHFEKENPVFQIDAQDNRLLNHRRTYLISSEWTEIDTYDENREQVEGGPQPKLTMLVMDYLRSNIFTPDERSSYAHVPEPRLDRQGVELFEQAAAVMAIESATIDIPSLASRGYLISADKSAYESDHQTVLSQGVKIQGTFYPYTRSPRKVQEELSRLTRAVTITSRIRSLPPAPDSPPAADQA